MSRSAVMLAVAVCLWLVASLSGCAKSDASGAAPPTAAADPADSKGAGPELPTEAKRKIIFNAELFMTVSSAASAQRDSAKIAEQYGGYLVSSDAHAGGSQDAREPGSVRVVLRVHADELESALDALRRLGKQVGTESVTSKDVTEEWLDVGARIKTQRKLEEQYLEILKGATKVDELLSVQKQLADVRGEIEKLEGRKRYLDDQVSLSTVTVTFEEERPLVAITAAAFGRAARQAWADAQNVTAAIALGSIRLLGVMLPVVLFVLLPLYLVGKRAVRRLMRATAPS